jgi:hypothetical protein
MAVNWNAHTCLPLVLSGRHCLSPAAAALAGCSTQCTTGGFEITMPHLQRARGFLWSTRAKYWSQMCLKFIWIFADAPLLRRTASYKYSGVCYNERCYNERCYNERCYNEQFLSIRSGCYNEHSQTRIHYSESWTNTLQLMNLPQDSHSRWAEATTPFIPLLCDFERFLLGKVLFIVFTNEKLLMFFSNLHVRTVCRSEKNKFFVTFTHIFDFVLYFSCSNCCVGNFALGCGPGTDCH